MIDPPRWVTVYTRRRVLQLKGATFSSQLSTVESSMEVEVAGSISKVVVVY